MHKTIWVLTVKMLPGDIAPSMVIGAFSTAKRAQDEGALSLQAEALGIDNIPWEPMIRGENDPTVIGYEIFGGELDGAASIRRCVINDPFE